MKLVVVAVGTHQPSWAEAAWADYAKRFPRELQVELRAVKTESRRGGRTAAQAMAAERERMQAAVPKGAHRVALDEHGTALTTQALAQRLGRWKRLGSDVAFLIGGPDGLDDALLNAAEETMRLSDLTLPHALARVVLVEQLYRAWSIGAGLPYHRA